MIVALEVLYPTHFTLVYGEEGPIGSAGDHGGDAGGGAGEGAGGEASAGEAHGGASHSETPTGPHGAGHDGGGDSHHHGGGAGGHNPDHVHMTPLEV